MAEKSQDKVRELKDLIVTYAKQETLDPIKGLGRYAGFGVAGAALLGVGIFFLAIGLLRFLQTQTDTALTGNWSWVPYLVVVIVLVAFAVLAWLARGKRKEPS